MFAKMKNLVLSGLAAVGLMITAGSAMAEAPVLTTLTSAVDFSTVVTAILALGAALIGVYIVMKAVTFVLKALQRG